MSDQKYKFSPSELQSIAKLPPEIAALAERHPISIINAGDSWDIPPFPSNYIPHLVEIYYEDADGPDVFIMDGKLKSYKTKRHPEAPTSMIAVMIDDQWSYIQVEGKEVLNRLGGVILPDVIVIPEILCHSILKGDIDD